LALLARFGVILYLNLSIMRRISSRAILPDFAYCLLVIPQLQAHQDKIYSDFEFDFSFSSLAPLTFRLHNLKPPLSLSNLFLMLV